MAPRKTEINAVVALLEGEAEDVEELAARVIETVLANHAKHQKFLVVAQEVDMTTRMPIGDSKLGDASPLGNATAFPPVSTYKQARGLAMQVGLSSTKTRTANAWVVPYFDGTPASWWRSLGEDEMEQSA